MTFKNCRDDMTATVSSGDMDARAHRNQGIKVSSSVVVSTFS